MSKSLFDAQVDDIVIITSGREGKERFVELVEKLLPQGLELNPSKRQIVGALKKATPTNAPTGQFLFSFNYLGYKFSIFEPVKKSDSLNRSLAVDIAEQKVKKLKTRIVRSFWDFRRVPDWQLLKDRISFLTQNFSVYNAKAGGKKLAGIFHSYPLITESAGALLELDRFLRTAVLSRTGPVYSKSAAILTADQRRQLLKRSFVRGHADKSFVHFSSNRISEIQRCWKY